MPFLSPQVPIAGQNGLVTNPWFGFFQDLVKQLSRAAGQNVFTWAQQPTLGPQDAGYIGLVSDFGHLVRWTGTVWQFAPGDVGNGFIVQHVVAPQEVGWGLCNGATYSYLVMGPTMTTINYTTSVIANFYFRR